MIALTLVLAVELNGIGRVLFDIAAVVLVFPTLIFFGALSAPRGLTERVCDLAGRASYGIYALQFPFIELLKLSYSKIRHHQLSELGSLGVFAVCALTIGAALVLDAVYDSPARKYLRSRFARRGKAAIA
jgi:peptidoglycan/LPS O-acetylase OafA/YrhL